MKITKEILEDAKNWYSKGNSIRKVEKLIQEKHAVKVGKETVRRCLSEIIELRTKKEVMTMKRGNELVEDRIVRFYIKKKLSLKQIAKKFNASESGIKWILIKKKVKLRSKREGLLLVKRKYEKPPFKGTEMEKAYLMGITLGDLHVRNTSNFTIEANTTTTREAMIKLLISTFEKYTDGIYWYSEEKKGFRFCAYLDRSFDFLISVKKNVNMIEEFNKKEFLSFLAGFFDAEGCIAKKRRKNKIRYEITISNTDRRVLEIINEKLKETGINSTICIYTHAGSYHFYDGKNVINRKQCYNLTIWNKNEIINFLNAVDFKHEEKIKRKLDILESSFDNT